MEQFRITEPAELEEKDFVIAVCRAKGQNPAKA
jgi:hypothetical protein